jgi:pimeloyl-ACP methyl ester carboxylesterase
MAQLPSDLSAPNPAMALYSAGALARGFGLALRGTNHLAPGIGTRLALRMFFTPLPSKLAARRQRVPAPWQAQAWPFEQASITAYCRSNTPPGAPRVLLVHGWAGNALQMRLMGDALAQAGFDAVLLDLPAHGRSDGWRSSLPQFVRGLWAASARLGPFHAVVAHSMGARAASHAVASGLPVERLVLVAPSPGPRDVLQWFTSGFGLRRLDQQGLAQRMGEVIERREGMALDRFEWAWLAPRLSAPLLVVHDRADKVAPFAVGQDVVGRVGGAVLRATQGLGHKRLLADAAVAEAVVAHVSGTTASDR